MWENYYALVLFLLNSRKLSKTLWSSSWNWLWNNFSNDKYHPPNCTWLRVLLVIPEDLWEWYNEAMCNVQSITENIFTDGIKIRKTLWKIPTGNNLKKIWWFYTWPIKMFLTITVPSPKTWRKLYPITFIMCIVWIGVNAYLVFWMVAVIGKNKFDKKIKMLINSWIRIIYEFRNQYWWWRFFTAILIDLYHKMKAKYETDCCLL